MTQPRYKMEIDINVLNHLGINLYSNVPAVLAEVIANAWDADATEVKINWSGDNQEDFITIEDNGAGLSENEINNQFLRVGYQRRKIQGERTPQGRLPMGRKGIGKLSLFSIANIIEVHTSNGKEENAFSMNLDDIKRKQNSANKSDNTYEPLPIEFDAISSSSGTKIIIKNFNKKITRATTRGLIHRVARRFTVGSKDFNIYFGKIKIEAKHRGYYDKMQFVWIYGNEFSKNDFIKLKNCEQRENVVEKDHEKLGKILVTGWLGTVEYPRHLKNENSDKNESSDKNNNSENLNRIAIYIRGKMAQENMLRDLSESSVYISYIAGEINVDWMDDDKEDDMATTDRQGLVEDDERYLMLKKFIKKEVRYIDARWKELRSESFVEKIDIPEVLEWLNEMRESTRKKAKKWIGRLGMIRNDDIAKRALLKASILAFEFYSIKESLDNLDKIDDESLENILEIFVDIDDLETSFYGQIVKGRREIIKALADKLDDDKKEKVIQKYLFNHLWLLDPSFERAQGTEAMEKNIQSVLNEDTSKLTKEEKAGRIDIGYRTFAGKHVIVELKRGSVRVSLSDLVKQIGKYRSAILKVLSEHETYKTWNLEIICLLGKQPNECYNQPGGDILVRDVLKALDARVVCYSTLLDNAQTMYADYIEKSKKIDRLWKIFEAIENFTP